MTTIEYGEKRIEVPDCWDDITLGKYETVSAMPAKTAKEKVEMMAEICGVEVSVLLDWPAEIFNRMVEITGFLFREEEKVEPAASIEIDGVQYAVPIGDKITLGVWVDVDEVQKIGQNVLSGVLAIVCRPVGEEYDGNNNEVRQRLFAALPVSRVMPVLAFFFALQKRIRETYRGLFTPLPGDRPISPEYRKFATVWGWYKIIADLAEGRILDFDRVATLPVEEAFTFLQFRRDQDFAEKAQRKLDRFMAKNRRNENR